MRLLPSDRELRKLAPAGIEFAPPRKEVSTGPGRHDFEIVADPSLSVEDDMRRRDFTVNAIARRLATGELVDPLERPSGTSSSASCAPCRRRASPRIRCGSCARSGSSRSSDFDLDDSTLRQMREEAAAVKLVSGERVGGGLAADGLGELSKLLLGRHPAKALRLARDTGVLVELLPEFERAIGFDQESRYHSLTVDEHTFAVVQAAADAGYALPVRLAALFHDLGKPHVAWRGTDGRLHYYAKPGYSDRSHEQVGCELAREALLRLRYPNALRDRVVRDRAPPHVPDREGRRACARGASSRSTATSSHSSSSTTRTPTTAANPARTEPGPLEDLEKLARFRTVLEVERRQPHRLPDLAIDGNDLIELGFRPGPELGRVLRDLLHDVVDDPSLNTREALLARARMRR